MAVLRVVLAVLGGGLLDLGAYRFLLASRGPSRTRRVTFGLLGLLAICVVVPTAVYFACAVGAGHAYKYPITFMFAVAGLVLVGTFADRGDYQRRLRKLEAEDAGADPADGG